MPADPTTHGRPAHDRTDPRRPRRRINPDKPPFDTLPAIKADGPEGPIRVLRGEVDLDKLTDRQRHDVQLMHEHEFVVLTNSLGDHQLAWRGQLMDPDLDLSRFGDLPLTDEFSYLTGYRAQGDSLEDMVDLLRQRAKSCTMLADYYQSLVEDGWKRNLDPSTFAYGNLVDTSTDGESFAPGPRR